MANAFAAYVYSPQTWSFDSLSYDSSIGFYTNAWLDADGEMPNEDESNIVNDNACSYFYQIEKEDETGFTPNRIMMNDANGILTIEGKQKNVASNIIKSFRMNSPSPRFLNLRDSRRNRRPARFNITSIITDANDELVNIKEYLGLNEEENASISRAEEYEYECLNCDEGIEDMDSALKMGSQMLCYPCQHEYTDAELDDALKSYDAEEFGVEERIENRITQTTGLDWQTDFNNMSEGEQKVWVDNADPNNPTAVKVDGWWDGEWVCLHCGDSWETQAAAIRCAEWDGYVLEGREEWKEKMIEKYSAEEFGAEEEEYWEYHVYVSNSPTDDIFIVDNARDFGTEEPAIKAAHKVSNDDRGKGKMVYVVAEEREMDIEKVIYMIDEGGEVLSAEGFEAESFGAEDDFAYFNKYQNFEKNGIPIIDDGYELSGWFASSTRQELIEEILGSFEYDYLLENNMVRKIDDREEQDAVMKLNFDNLFGAEYDPIHVGKLKIQQRMMANAPLCEECGEKKRYTPTEYNRYTCWPCKDDPSWGAESFGAEDEDEKAERIMKLLRIVKRKATGSNARYAKTYAREAENAYYQYGMGGLTTQVAYVLSNLSGWRGEEAKSVKAELRKLIK